MNEDCFVELLNVVKPFMMKKKNTQLRDAIPPEESLALVLKFLATGETFRSLDYQTRISVAYISQLVPYCCYILYTKLKHKYLKFPTCAEWKKVADDFMQRWQFPLCLGALDGKHVGFRSSKINGSLYYNYKGFNSIVLLAMCDSHYKFTYINVGCNGRISDGGVLNRSDLMYIIDNSSLYFRPDEVIGANRKLLYCIIGDDAFPLQRHKMKPYPYNSSEHYKKVFNSVKSCTPDKRALLWNAIKQIPGFANYDLLAAGKS